jgi:hypothetical protein
MSASHRHDGVVIGAGLEISTVVEAAASGTVLIGASRERVGFDRTSSMKIVGALAAQAVPAVPCAGRDERHPVLPGLPALLP